MTASAAAERPNILLEETLADLQYLEPARTRNRLISCLNEIFIRLNTLEHMHQDHADH